MELVIKCLVASLFATAASFSPFFALFMQDKGFNAFEVGSLLSFSRVVMLMTTPIVCSIADRRCIHRELLAGLSFAAAVTMLCFSLAPTGHFLLVAAILAAYACCSGSKMAICDTIVLHNSPNGAMSYPHQRLWGSISWGVVSLTIGMVLRQMHTRSYEVVPLLHMASLLLFGCVLLFLVKPLSNNSNSSAFGGSGRKGVEGGGGGSNDKSNSSEPSSWTSYVTMVSDARLLGPVVCGVALLSTIEVSMNNFMFPYARRVLKGPPELFSYILAIHAVSEVFAFSVGNTLLVKIGPKWMLTISACAFGAKAFWYARMTNPWSLLLIESIHGMCFAFMWTASVSHVTRCAFLILGQRDSVDKKTTTSSTSSSSAIVGGAGGVGNSIAVVAMENDGDEANGATSVAGKEGKDTSSQPQGLPSEPVHSMRTASIAMTTLWFFAQGLPPIIGGLVSGAIVEYTARKELTLFHSISLLSLCVAGLFLLYGRLGLLK